MSAQSTTPVSSAGGLEVDSISRKFGEMTALDNLTFDVRPGELFGFVGSNGAGKTTAMRIVLGVLTADSGQVRWGGQAITSDTRRTIGYMPEERGLYPRMKVGEQLAYLARLHGLSPSAARRAVDDWTERLGIASRRADDVQTLSLGNQQRVQLAAALVHDPRILVLDEPFSGLDPVAVDVMSGVLREKCNDGVPAVFSSHQLDLVERLCDRVGIIQSGRIVAIGSVDELREGASAQLVVRAPTVSEGWATGLPGVVTETRAGDVTTLEMATGADDQAVLAAALRLGPVHEFGWRRSTLAELFRHVVTQPDTPDADEPTSGGTQ